MEKHPWVSFFKRHPGRKLIRRNQSSKCVAMAIRVVEFSSGGYKIRKIFHKNQHTRRKLLNFEFLINVELSKIGHHFSNKVFKKKFIKKCQLQKMCS